MKHNTSLLSRVSHSPSSSRGFTLIELVVVFTVIVILSSVGIASFVTYSRSQQIDTNMKELKSVLFTARSRALSQLRDSSCFSGGFSGQGYELVGYQVVMCCSFVPLCSFSETCKDSSNSYELQAVYDSSGGAGRSTQTCTEKKFTDPNITVDSSNATTATYFFFASLTGAVTTNAATGQIPKVSLTGYGVTKSASISATGVIQ